MSIIISIINGQTSFPQNVPSHRGETDVFAGNHNAQNWKGDFTVFESWRLDSCLFLGLLEVRGVGAGDKI